MLGRNELRKPTDHAVPDRLHVHTPIEALEIDRSAIDLSRQMPVSATISIDRTLRALPITESPGEQTQKSAMAFLASCQVTGND